MFDKAVEVSRKAVDANPKNRELKLMLAGELADQGKTEEGLAHGQRAPGQHRRKTARCGWRWARCTSACTAGRMPRKRFNKADALTTKKEDRIYLLFLRGELG